MRPTLIKDRPVDLQRCLDKFPALVRSAVGTDTPVHEVERGLWRQLLQLGYQLQRQFFSWMGAGAQGEIMILAEGPVVWWLPERHRRPYQLVFGVSIWTRWCTARGKANKSSSYPWMPWMPAWSYRMPVWLSKSNGLYSKPLTQGRARLVTPNHHSYTA